ncbi:MAG: helix-turn-helix domain-containing protein, partial [Raoultibacter sp.]
ATANPATPTAQAPVTPPAKRVYPTDLKHAAVLAFLDEGLTRKEVVKRFDIASVSTLKKWVIAYRRGGAQALSPKPQGRPRGQWIPKSMATPDELVARAEVERLIRKLNG